MRFGKIALTFLLTGILTIVAMIIFRPGWGYPIVTLGGLLIAFTVPAALIAGTLGIFRDKNKLLAIITTIIACGLIGLYVYIDYCNWIIPISI